ncbi:MAG TPA: hypothetical protein VN887_05210, partial [Candidatus Angelobacter sp.]|nr:hypothetical protein [Candidatus Angelobacter sp.]
MKTKLTSKLFPLLLLCLAVGHETLAQVSAFTYQGRLEFNGAPANGSYDFMFRLMNDPTNGVVAPVIPVNLAVPVTNGLFTTGMDFGAANLDGTNLWLEVNVRTNNGASFTPLSPRQLLTSTPYAIRAANASNLSGTLSVTQLSGQLSGAQIGNGAVNAANVDNTQVQLRITGTAPAGQFITGIAANGSVTVGSDTTDWKLGGNSVSGGQFLGSTNNQPVEVRVNGQNALRLQPGTNDAPNIVGGAPGNFIAGNVVGSTIGGGGSTNYNGVFRDTNFIGADFSVIAGGAGNRIESRNSFLGGGLGNIIQVPYSAIGGGSG